MCEGHGKSSVKVGFIGLGAMGLPMAKRVLAAGYETFTTFHRRREPAQELEGLGARVLNAPADVAREADVVITIVPADAELKETVLGDKGLVDGFSPGKILIDMTTATALILQEVEKAICFHSPRRYMITLMICQVLYNTNVVE